MASIYNPENNSDKSYLAAPFNFKRGNPIPLDSSTIFTSLSAAQDYATNSAIAYVGQIVTVVDSTEQNTEVDGKVVTEVISSEINAYVVTGKKGEASLKAIGGDAAVPKIDIINGGSASDFN